MKTCSKCRRILDNDHFSRDKTKSDGRLSYCKDCRRVYLSSKKLEIRKQRQGYWIKNAEQLKAKQVQYRKDKRAERKEYADKYRADNVEKISAHKQLRNAIRRGEIKRPDVCSWCGYIGRIEGHHNDYSKPLEVQWLCRSCHMRAHRF